MTSLRLFSSWQKAYQDYTKKADILETAQAYFMDKLQYSALNKDIEAEEVWQYVWKIRGYTYDDIYDMQLGAYTDRQALQEKLMSSGYTEQEIKDSGLLTKDLGDVYKLTLLWRDAAGRAIGIAARALIPEEELLSAYCLQCLQLSGRELSASYSHCFKAFKVKIQSIHNSFQQD